MIERMYNQADKALDKSQKAIEKQILRYYSETLKELRARIAVYEAKGIFNKNEMFKYNRLTRLEKEISKEIGKLTGKSARTLKAGLGKLYEESYYRTAYILEKNVEARLGYSLLNPKVIEKSILNPLDRIKWPQRNKLNQAILTKQVREELTKGLLQGKSYRDVAKKIKERLNIGASKALRITQTESHRVREDSRLESMKYASNKGVIMKKRWVATLDSRTRDSHQELDGVEVNLDEDFRSPVTGASGPAPGQLGTPEDDINCRCTVISVIKGYEPSVRRAREIEGKRGEIISYKNYKEWHKNRIKR